MKRKWWKADRCPKCHHLWMHHLTGDFGRRPCRVVIHDAASWPNFSHCGCIKRTPRSRVRRYTLERDLA